MSAADETLHVYIVMANEVGPCHSEEWIVSVHADEAKAAAEAERLNLEQDKHYRVEFVVDRHELR